MRPFHNDKTYTEQLTELLGDHVYASGSIPRLMIFLLCHSQRRDLPNPAAVAMLCLLMQQLLHNVFFFFKMNPLHHSNTSLCKCHLLFTG